MEPQETLPTWAPRIPQSRIRQLYENDAQGLCDVDLLNEVGWALLARCKSFIAAVAAAQGRVTCPVCEALVRHHARPDEILNCASCGWRLPWKSYFATIQHKQLSGAEPVVKFFQEFIDRFPLAKEPQEKMLQIDRLIHGWHWWALRQMETRTTGVNLIEGNYHEVVDFLDDLTYGPASTPGLREQRIAWREIINRNAELWGDERLRRKPET